MNLFFVARIVAAFKAFRDSPLQRWAVVDWVEPIGWRILEIHPTYVEADAVVGHWRERTGGRVRIMAESDWARRTLSAWGSTGGPWLAVFDLSRRLQVAESDLADLKARTRINHLGHFMAREPSYMSR